MLVLQSLIISFVACLIYKSKMLADTVECRIEGSVVVAEHGGTTARQFSHLILSAFCTPYG